MSSEEKEKKNKRTGILISLGSHIAVILLFIFLVAWRAPNPPLPEFGIELNFGTSDQGTGDVQPETPAAVSEAEEEAAPGTPEEVIEEVVEETSTPIEEVTEVVEEVTEPVEETTEQITPVTDIPTEAPVEEVKETPKEVKKPVEEVKKEEPEPTPPKILYPGKKDGAAGTTGESNNPANANQGDKTDAVGDQGDEDGDVDARSLYGNSGGGGGEGLNMPGWVLDREPRPEHGPVENAGRIEFDFKVDEKGQVFGVKVTKYTVSPTLMQLYKKELEQLTLSKTSSGKAPPISNGKITFIIKAK